MWPQCSKVHCQQEAYHTCKLSPPILQKVNSHRITSQVAQGSSSPFCFIHIENVWHSRKQTWVERRTATDYAHVKYVPGHAAHLTEAGAKLRYCKQQSVVSKPITQNIRSATDTNYVLSLFASLVPDTRTILQHLYSAKVKWRHLTSRFCFLRCVNRTLVRGKYVWYCVCHGRR